jgi:SAM-dependent methyltransferase
LVNLGRFEEAVAVYRTLVASKPRAAEAYFNLGNALRELGQLDEAVRHYETALSIKPDFVNVLVNLSFVLNRLGRPDEALQRAIAALRLKPDLTSARLAFIGVLGSHAPSAYSPEIDALLEGCLEANDVHHGDLGRVAAWQLCLKYRIGDSPAEAAVAARTAVNRALAGGGDGILADPMLHLLLNKTKIRELRLEAFLTAARRQFLFAEKLPESLRPFLAALAMQCFNNVYVFGVDDEEEARAQSGKAALESELPRFAAPTLALEERLLRYALYAPLSTLAGAEKLLLAPVEAWSAPLRPLLDHCLREPAEEAAIAPAIPALGVIADATSRAVQRLYEDSPYPRWLFLPPVAPVSQAVRLRRKFPNLTLPSFFGAPHDILVAGCGTGAHPISLALSLKDVRILAADLSRASLAYATRMARKLGVTNVEFLQADILALGGLKREFALIESIGVLHHMKDPMAGWRALTALLRPGGLMVVGLYSAAARTEIAAARERVAALGLAPVARDIRAFRQRVLFGAEAAQFADLAKAKDIYDLNGCRDLLFHVQEHRFTLVELRGMMAALGLEFLGFDFPNDDIPRRYRAANPGDAPMTDLALWARFEAAHPDTFLGMYVFWCRKPV